MGEYLEYITDFARKASENPIALIGFVIAIVVIVVLISVLASAKNKKKRKAFFKNTMKKFIEDDIPERNAFLEDVYKAFVSSAKSSEKHAKLTEIPALKKAYRNSLLKLVELSKDNTMFLSRDEYETKLDQNWDIQTRANTDMIEALPVLADFCDIHFRLVNVIYSYISKVIDMYMYLWRGFPLLFRQGNTDGMSTQEKKWVDSSFEQAERAYKHYAETFVWEQGICKTRRKYNSEKNYEQFIKCVEKDDEGSDLFSTWVNVWVKSMEKTAKKEGYCYLYDELYSFFDEIRKEFSNYTWLPVSVASSLTRFDSYLFHLTKIDENSKEELLRICELYKQGILTGPYIELLDPKYKAC